MTIIAQPEGKEGVPAGGKLAEEKSGMFGVRAGVLAPGAASDDHDEYPVGPLLGAFYRGLQLAEKSLAWEVGAQFGSTTGLKEQRSSVLTLLSGSVLYGKWYSESSTKFYLHAGGAMVLETERSAKAGTLDLGAGLGLGRFDVRFGFSLLLGSQNITNMITGTAGYLF